MVKVFSPDTRMRARLTPLSTGRRPKAKLWKQPQPSVLQAPPTEPANTARIEMSLPANAPLHRNGVDATT